MRLKQDDAEMRQLNKSIVGAKRKLEEMQKKLTVKQKGFCDEAKRLKLKQRADLLLDVGRLLQGGGFGDSSTEEDMDEPVPAATSQKKQVDMASGATQTTPRGSDAATSQTALPMREDSAQIQRQLGPQAREFMGEEGMEWVQGDKNIVLQCCYESAKRPVVQTIIFMYII
jgi:hypothetical protein